MNYGRNDPCPCGSGRKYKHCCQAKFAARGSNRVTTTSQPDVARLLQAGQAHHGAGNLAEAENLYRQVLQANPKHPDALHLLGLIAYQAGHHDDAMGLIRQAIAVNHRAPHYHNSLGLVLIALGRTEEAVASYRKALRIDPSSAEAHNNLGSAMLKTGRFVEAVECYRRSLQLGPENPKVWNNLGAALQGHGEVSEMVSCYTRALELAPDNPEALVNLGNAFCNQGRCVEAIALYERVLQMQPDHAMAHNNLGHALRLQGRLPESIASFKAAVKVNPNFGEAWSNYLFSLNYASGYSAREIFEEHVRFGGRLEESVAGLRAAHGNARDPGKRLKIGYVSPDFRGHAVAYFFEPVLERHDRAGFETYCYFNNLAADEVTQRLKGLAHHWRNIIRLTEDDAVRLIRQDGIDILVDLAGYTAGHRLGIFARKPAPVQATWLGYLSTTGLGSIDYRITDVSADPAGLSERYHTEELVRLPDTFACYRPPAHSPAVGDLPALKNGYVTFASFNNLAKVTPEVCALWARVLLAVPGSRLMLKTKALNDPQTRQRFVAEFARHGVAAARLELVAWDASHAQHLERYNLADIGLDPFPCTGGTTSFDAMWMGVPVISLAGDRFISRMGVSMLASLGLTQLIANTPDDYVAIAAGLAGDLERLGALRNGLRERMAASALTDAKRFTSNLEAAYRGMWKKWCGK